LPEELIKDKLLKQKKIMAEDVELNSVPGRGRSLFRLLRGKGKLWENSRFILAEVPLNQDEAKKICGFAYY